MALTFSTKDSSYRILDKLMRESQLKGNRDIDRDDSFAEGGTFKVRLRRVEFSNGSIIGQTPYLSSKDDIRF